MYKNNPFYLHTEVVWKLSCLVPCAFCSSHRFRSIRSSTYQILTMTNPLNVYKGPESVRNYFDPDSAPPLPLVELPDALNPYRQNGVRIYAKMMTMHPTNNVKSMPGSQIHLSKNYQRDIY